MKKWATAMTIYTQSCVTTLFTFSNLISRIPCSLPKVRACRKAWSKPSKLFCTWMISTLAATKIPLKSLNSGKLRKATLILKKRKRRGIPAHRCCRMLRVQVETCLHKILLHFSILMNQIGGLKDCLSQPLVISLRPY